jgi:hypothetical protein
MSLEGDELGPIRRIKTETALSRLPIHNLAKKGRVNIQIVKKDAKGQVTLQWEVSHSERYGQPRQIAYKLDTIVINRRLDEQGRPLPKMVCLGSLREIADELGLGGDTNLVRRAIRQNAFAAITARLTYTAADGRERRLEADFTRYSVIFTGEKLPDGRRADAVYIILNEPYREVLDNAPQRPLNYEYLKVLPPAAQRFLRSAELSYLCRPQSERGCRSPDLVFRLLHVFGAAALLRLRPLQKTDVEGPSSTPAIGLPESVALHGDDRHGGEARLDDALRSRSTRACRISRVPGAQGKGSFRHA